MPTNNKKSKPVRIPPDVMARLDAWVDRYCDEEDSLPPVQWLKYREDEVLPRSEVIRVALDALEREYGQASQPQL